MFKKLNRKQVLIPIVSVLILLAALIPIAYPNDTGIPESYTNRLTTRTLTIDDLEAPVTRAATYTVAASDAPQIAIDQADYVCSGVNDDVEIQAAIDAVLTLGAGTVQTVGGNFYFSTTITCNGYPDNVNLDFSESTFNYSGTGTAFDLNTHRCNIDLGQILAAGDAVTGSSAVGIDFDCYWTCLRAYVNNFQAGKGLVISGDSNVNDLEYLRIKDTKVGLHCDTTGGFNNFGIFDYRNATTANSSAIEIGSSGSMWNAVFDQVSVNWYNDLSGCTVFKAADLKFPMTIQNLGFESDCTGETILFDLTHVTYKGVIILGNLHISNTAGGKCVNTGNGVNISHNTGGNNLVPSHIYEPIRSTDFVAYNCTRSIDTSTTTSKTNHSLKLTSLSEVSTPQIEIAPKDFHLAEGSLLEGGFSIYSDTADVVVRFWYNPYNSADSQLQGITIGYFKVPAADTWYRVDMTSFQYMIPQTAVKGHLQITIDKDTLDSTTLYFSEFTLYGKEQLPETSHAGTDNTRFTFKGHTD